MKHTAADTHRRVVGGYAWRDEWEGMAERNAAIRTCLAEAYRHTSANREAADLLVQALTLHTDNMLAHAELSTYQRKGTPS